MSRKDAFSLPSGDRTAVFRHPPPRAGRSGLRHWRAARGTPSAALRLWRPTSAHPLRSGRGTHLLHSSGLDSASSSTKEEEQDNDQKHDAETATAVLGNTGPHIVAAIGEAACGRGGLAPECTSHLRYKTDQGPALQRRGTLVIPQLWSYAR
jgi:hypothetical protein